MEKDQLGSVKGLTPEEIGFLENQIDNIITDFTKFLFRYQKTIAKRAFVQLPRLIRWSDKLGKDQRTSEFKSPVTTVTNELALLDDYGKYEFPDKVSNTEEGKLIHEVYDGFRELIEIISDEVKLKEKENEFVELKELKREQYRNLLNIAHDDVIDSVIDKATKIVELQDLVRLVYFSNFIIHRCTFAMVTASDPSSAFDIYEALNTTGVPLTAIETLKPDVINYFNTTKGTEYEGSSAEEALLKIENIFNNFFPSTSEQELETKIITSAANVYIDGRRIGASLSLERRALRDLQKEAQNVSKPAAVVSTLCNILEYRQNFFRQAGIDNLQSTPLSKTNSEIDETKLIALVFFKAQKRLVAAPLCRYYLLALSKRILVPILNLQKL